MLSLQARQGDPPFLRGAIPCSSTGGNGKRLVWPVSRTSTPDTARRPSLPRASCRTRAPPRWLSRRPSLPISLCLLLYPGVLLRVTRWISQDITRIGRSNYFFSGHHTIFTLCCFFSPISSPSPSSSFQDVQFHAPLYFLLPGAISLRV